MSSLHEAFQKLIAQGKEKSLINPTTTTTTFVISFACRLKSNDVFTDRECLHTSPSRGLTLITG